MSPILTWRRHLSQQQLNESIISISTWSNNLANKAQNKHKQGNLKIFGFEKSRRLGVVQVTVLHTAEIRVNWLVFFLIALSWAIMILNHTVNKRLLQNNVLYASRNIAARLLSALVMSSVWKKTRKFPLTHRADPSVTTVPNLQIVSITS